MFSKNISAELVNKAKAGNQAAMVEIVKILTPYIEKLANSIKLDKEKAKVYAAFGIAKALDKFKGERSFYGLAVEEIMESFRNIKN